MAFSKSAKNHMRLLYNHFNSSTFSRLGYTTWACRALHVTKLREGSNICSQFPSVRQIFVRSFAAAEVSSSEQLNLIKLLRERTSAPIKDVKSSLINCNWDIESAQKDLRKRGIIVASKKSSRTASEGLLALAQNDSQVAVIELNCETDFVARNEIFQYLALSLAKVALSVESSADQVYATSSLGSEYLEGLKVNLDHPKLSGETTVQDVITEVAAMVGENVKLRRGYTMSKSSNGVISSYLHTSPQPGLGRLAGILTLEVEDENAPLDALVRGGSQLAMHIVASKPLYLSSELVSSEALDSERDVLKSQAEATGKSPMAIEKMVEGRLRKYMEEVVLMEQKFVMNDAIKVKTLIDDLSKEVGSPVKIGNFFRMEVGEGLQRAETSSASDAVAQAA